MLVRRGRRPRANWRWPGWRSTAGELAHAAAHAGNAIAADPSLRAAYEILDELSAAAADVHVLFPVEGMPHVGTVAARSYLVAREGKLDDAFSLLCRAAEAVPGKPWAAGWLAAPGVSVPDLAGRMDPDIAVRFMSRLALSLPDPVDAEIAVALSPFLDVARVVASRHPEPATVLPRLSGLARRMGESGKAVAWCEQAEKSDPSALAAIMLGYALRNAGRPEQAHDAWLRALRRDPGSSILPRCLRCFAGADARTVRLDNCRGRGGMRRRGGARLYGERKRFRFRAADAAAERDGNSCLRAATRSPKE